MQAPFLELAFYVGLDEVDKATASVASEMAAKGRLEGTRIIGLKDRPEEVLALGGSVLVRTEGADFSGPRRDDTARLKALGRQVYLGFVAIAGSIDCLYGAILGEYTLESPQELREDPRSLAFQNFYLNRARLPATLVPRLLALVPPEAYVRELDHGVYVSMGGEFNPESRSVENERAQYISGDIAKVIGAVLGGS